MRWVIGDIHGMLGPLEALLEAVRARDRDPQFYFVGDYVNRGPHSRGVIDLLLTLPSARFCRGNHDDVFDEVLRGQSFGNHPALADPITAFLTFMQYGLDATLMSYGLDGAELDDFRYRPGPRVLEAIRGIVPEAHKRFIRTLPAAIEDFDLFVAHAMWHPEVPTDAPDIASRVRGNAHVRQSVIWGRFSGEQLTAPKVWRRTGYFGHTPVEVYPAYLRGNDNVPIASHQVVLLDTGCALSAQGQLSAVCADDGRIVQASRQLEIREVGRR